MDSVLQTLFLRSPKLHYVSPPVCDNLFSSSSGPIIVLNAQGHLVSPTGLILGGVGNSFLTWSSYPGALCYSIYKSVNPDDPFGSYVIIAECVPNFPFDLTPFGSGNYRITVITPEGETPFSTPIHFDGPTIIICPSFNPPSPSLSVDATTGDDLILGPFNVDEGAFGGPVTYQWFKDGIFFEDTTGTTTDSLTLADAQPSDSGTYNLHLANSVPSCDKVSDDIDLSVSDETACCDCGTNVKIQGFNAALFTFTASTYKTITAAPTGVLSFSIPDNAWLGCSGVNFNVYDMGNAPIGYYWDGSAAFRTDGAGNCAINNNRVQVSQIDAYPAAVPVGGSYDIYTNPIDAAFGTPWDGSFTMTDPSHLTCAVQSFPAGNINSWGGFVVQMDQVPNGPNWDWTLTLTGYYPDIFHFSPAPVLWVGTLLNSPTQYGVYTKTGGVIFTGPASLTLEPA